MFPQKEQRIWRDLSGKVIIVNNIVFKAEKTAAGCCRLFHASATGGLGNKSMELCRVIETGDLR